jgi:sphingomyelin phosphodiesterase acid-like 3
VVTLMLAGHTHMDEFRIMPTGNVLEQLPGISPCFGNNPAYKVLAITQDTFVPTDYESLDYDLASSPAPTQFNSLYKMSITYGAAGTLDSTLLSLYPQLVGNGNQRLEYTNYFASGSTAVNPQTSGPFNPINSANWPIFACTIRQMDKPEYIGCVDTY